MSPQQLYLYTDTTASVSGKSLPNQQRKNSGVHTTQLRGKEPIKRVTFTDKNEVKTTAGVVTKKKKVSNIALPPIGPRSSIDPPNKKEPLHVKLSPATGILKQSSLPKEDNSVPSTSRPESLLSLTLGSHHDNEDTVSVDPCECDPASSSVPLGQQCPGCGGWKWTDQESDLAETPSQDRIQDRGRAQRSERAPRVPSPVDSEYDLEKDSLWYNRFGLVDSPVLSEDLEREDRQKMEDFTSNIRLSPNDLSDNQGSHKNSKSSPILPAIQNGHRLHKYLDKKRQKLLNTIHRDAYVETLSIARATQLPREPWLLATRTTPTVGFSYFSTKPTKPDYSHYSSGRVSRNPMNEIFGGADIDGYYTKKKLKQKIDAVSDVHNVVSHMSKLDEQGHF